MRQLLLSFFTTFILLYAPAQDITLLIKEADRLESLPNEKSAFEKHKEVLKLQPAHIYSLNKCSELCSRIGKRQTNAKQRDDYYLAAKTYAGIALKLAPTNSEANCVMAIALGRISLTKGGKEKINNAKEIKKHVDVALKSDPNNYKAWHVLGRWHYEISNLNMFERAAVKLLFGGLPQASMKESIKAFEKAHSLAGSGFLLNFYEMARAYKKDGQGSKAITAINTMLLLPNHTEDDPAIKNDGRKLLKEWE
jgi:tetratricopeptide (TPR) repeat protein